jgi:hypothetical protein
VASELPTRFRPRRAPRVIYPGIVLLVAAFTAFGLLMPGFGTPDRLMIIALGVAGAPLLLRLARLRIDADESGLTVVNVARRRHLEWAEVLAVRLPPGAPWLVLDLSDGTALQAMGIQASDGPFAREEALRLARLVAARTRTDRDS